MKTVRNILELLYRDVANENEPKKTAVIMRFYTLLMEIYYVMITIWMLPGGEHGIFLLVAACMICCLLAFVLTYRDATKWTILLSFATTMIWVVLMVLLVGWNSGVQHFVFSLVLLIFPVLLLEIQWKILLAFGVCAVRICLYFYTLHTAPPVILNQRAGTGFQMMNTISVFIIMIVVLSIYTKDSMEMERKLVEYNRKLHRLASVDPLTGLLNRRGIFNSMEEFAGRYRDSRMEGLCVAIADIDYFKKINDQYGHEGGDQVLKSVSARLRELMEEIGEDTVGRWGGEEFLIVFPGMNGDDAYMKLEKIYRELRHMQILYKGQQIRLALTYGLAEYDGAKEMDDTIRAADEKLYMGKEAGRDQIIY